MMNTHSFQVGSGEIHCHLVEDLWAAVDGIEPKPYPIGEMLKTFQEHYANFNASDWERVAEADLSYPIIYNEKNGVVDGRHRVIKALMSGERVIHVKVLNVYPEPYRIYESWNEFYVESIASNVNE